MRADRISLDPRRWVALALGAGALVGLALAVAMPVPQDRTALVLRFGQPARVINAWGAGGAGLALRVPLVDRVVWLDRRLMALSLDRTPITTHDGQPLIVDSYASWRVTDPARFYQALGTPDHAGETLRGILASVLRVQVGRSSVPGAMAMVRGDGASALRAAFDRELAGYGATATDVRVSRVALPDGAPLDAAYARMVAGAQADTAETVMQGHRDVAAIRADAEARARQIYAQSFGQDPQFYDFYRAMQSYDATLAQKGGHTTIVLGPDNAYLRQFRGK